MDYSTRLPPRKRLLAGMKRQDSVIGSDESVVLPFEFHSREIRARVLEVLNYNYASAEEFVVATKSVALAAEEVASQARVEALEKAGIAARVKAFARSALELVVSGSEGREGSYPARIQGKKRRVAVDVLYSKPNQFSGSYVDGDEDMARRLHWVMNSSPRRKTSKKHGGVAKMNGRDGEMVNVGNLAVVCNGNSDIGNAEFSGKENKGLLVKSKTSPFRRQGENHDTEKNGSITRAVPVGKKGKAKKKKMLLSQFCSRGSVDSRATQGSSRHSFSDEGELKNNAGNLSYLLDNKPSNANNVSDENESLWKRKKLKLSQFYSEGKSLAPACSKQGAAASSVL